MRALLNGCSRERRSGKAKKITTGLVSGVYFWEADPRRGLDFAREKALRKGSSIKNPAVVGAVIDLGWCLDMTTFGATELVEISYNSLVETFRVAGRTLPVNRVDMMRRPLDRAVIENLHDIYTGEPFDTVRGVFLEGGPVFEGSGLMKKTHTQIAVRNLRCIKGVFRVPDDQLKLAA